MFKINGNNPESWRDEILSICGNELSAKIMRFVASENLPFGTSDERRLAALAFSAFQAKMIREQDSFIKNAAAVKARAERENAVKDALCEWNDLASVMSETRFFIFGDLFEDDSEWMIATIKQCTTETRFAMDCHSLGVVYMMELPGGVKIGQTANIARRLKFHASAARNLGVPVGRIAISSFHGNFIENEKIAHDRLCAYRVKDTEFFATSFDNAIAEIGEFEISYPKGYRP